MYNVRNVKILVANFLKLTGKKKSMKKCLLFLLASLPLLCSAFSVTYESVTVSCDDIGVSDMRIVGKEIHICTTNVLDSFVAHVEIGSDGNNLRFDVDSTIDMHVGDIVNFEAKNIENDETHAKGTIVLYKVDVVLNDIGEDIEKTIGDFLRICTNKVETCKLSELRDKNIDVHSVKIKCYPSAGRPDSEILLVKNNAGDLYEVTEEGLMPANDTYRVNEINGIQFVAIGDIQSTKSREYCICAKHNDNGTNDGVLYSVYNCDFDAVADYDGYPNGTPNGILIDNYPVDIDVTISGVDDSDKKRLATNLSFDIVPTEKEGIINKAGTNVVCKQVKDKPLEFRCDKIYWYGVVTEEINECCYTYIHEYEFTLKLNNVDMVKKKYAVGWPNENPGYVFLFDYKDINKYEVFSNPKPTSTNDLYMCELTFVDFILIVDEFEDLPTTDQYSEETYREETYHQMQIKGEVPFDKGGLGHCYSKRGLIWCAGFGDTEGKIYVYGSTLEETEKLAKKVVCDAIKKECKISKEISEKSHLFREYWAKEYAGYNAAYKFHCTYEVEGMGIPEGVKHPGIEE